MLGLCFVAVQSWPKAKMCCPLSWHVGRELVADPEIPSRRLLPPSVELDVALVDSGSEFSSFPDQLALGRACHVSRLSHPTQHPLTCGQVLDQVSELQLRTGCTTALAVGLVTF